MTEQTEVPMIVGRKYQLRNGDVYTLVERDGKMKWLFPSGSYWSFIHSWEDESRLLGLTLLPEEPANPSMEFGVDVAPEARHHGVCGDLHKAPAPEKSAIPPMVVGAVYDVGVDSEYLCDPPWTLRSAEFGPDAWEDANGFRMKRAYSWEEECRVYGLTLREMPKDNLNPNITTCGNVKSEADDHRAFGVEAFMDQYRKDTETYAVSQGMPHFLDPNSPPVHEKPVFAEGERPASEVGIPTWREHREARITQLLGAINELSRDNDNDEDDYGQLAIWASELTDIYVEIAKCTGAE